MTAKTLLERDPTLLNEAEWSTVVVDTARLGGWTLRYHTFKSRRSASGFPDWTFFHPGRTRHEDDGTGPPALQPMLLVVELKTETGKLTAAQEEWIEALQELEYQIGRWPAAGVPETYWYPFRARVWRPRDWPVVAETLTGRRVSA